jgi:hypothetical protein
MYLVLSLFIEVSSFILIMVMFSLQALLGRPLKINFALEKARGGPVVVPRFSDNGRFNRH